MCVFIVMKEHVSQYNRVSLTDMIFYSFWTTMGPCGTEEQDHFIASCLLFMEVADNKRNVDHNQT